MGERRVTTISGDIRAISGTTIEAFATQLRGKLLTGDDDGYDTARKVWNGLVDKRPALIARCTGAADVITCVRFARDQDLLLSIHGGGHSIAGRAVCDNGIMIDLSQMKGICVDPNQQIAFAQPGLRLAEFDHETQAFGLATTLGVAGDTGISGLTLGGGYGWLNGRYGLACDNVLAADVVTADGHLVSANADENADLFWGIRGAGANFGVVTSFKYRLHPVGAVLAGLVLYPISQGRQVLQLYHEFSASCPDEVSTIGLVLSTPDGTPAVGIAACYTGPIDEGERILKPIRSFGPPILDLVAPRRYTEMQSLFDEGWVPGQLNYLKTSLIRILSDTAIDIVLEHALKRPTPTSVIYFQQLHGAASRRRSDETAFPHRFYHYDCGPWAIWRNPDDTDRCITWVRSCWEALRQVYEPSAYVNAVDDAVSDDEERVKSAYGPNYQRLAALKAKYDPTNQFRLNANIRSTLEEAV